MLEEAGESTCGPLQMFMYSASGTLVRTHSLKRFFARSWSSTAFSSAALRCSLHTAPRDGQAVRIRQGDPFFGRKMLGSTP